MKHQLFAMFLASSLLAALSPAQATPLANPSDAMLQSVSGKVLINSGNGFVSVQAETQIGLGTDVYVGEKSSAVVHFNAGNCNVLLPAGSVTHITDAGMCNEAMLDTSLPHDLRGLVDDVVITPVNGYVAPPPPPVVSGLLPPYAIAGGFLAIGTGTILYTSLQKDSAAPAPVSGP